MICIQSFDLIPFVNRANCCPGAVTIAFEKDTPTGFHPMKGAARKPIQGTSNPVMV
jgi:hypothetical protein